MDEEIGKEFLKLVEKLLAKFPHLEVVREETTIKVISGQPNGFDVEAEDDYGECTVYGGPWHAHFNDPQEAAAVFSWLLTRWARIRVVEQRGKFCSSSAELFRNGSWEGAYAVGVLWPQAGRKAVRYLQNDLIDFQPPKDDDAVDSN